VHFIRYSLIFQTLPYLHDFQKVVFGIRFADGTSKGVECLTYIHTNNWYHLCFTYDGTIERLYINNLLVDTTHVSKLMGVPTAPMTIGKYIHPSQPTVWPYYVNGIIDELYIFNRALSVQEVSILYNEKVCFNPISVNITNLNSTYSINDQPVPLIGTPAGGVFYGTGILGNTFYPGSAGAGTHTIVYAYTDSLGCSGAICDAVTISTTVKIEEIKTTDKTLNIYPNPSNGEFRITFNDNNNKDVIVTVTNTLGQTVYTNTFENNSETFDKTINLKAVTDGLYTVTIDNGEIKMTGEIVKQK